MDTNQRLRRLLDERGWTEYKLSQVCGLSQSTLANIFKRNIVHSNTTVTVICKAFGIPLSHVCDDLELVGAGLGFAGLPVLADGRRAADAAGDGRLGHARLADQRFESAINKQNRHLAFVHNRESNKNATYLP